MTSDPDDAELIARSLAGDQQPLRALGALSAFSASAFGSSVAVGK